MSKSSDPKGRLAKYAGLIGHVDASLEQCKHKKWEKDWDILIAQSHALQE